MASSYVPALVASMSAHCSDVSSSKNIYIMLYLCNLRKSTPKINEITP